MKKAIWILCVAAALVAPALAISQKRIESAQKRATSGNKLIAFVVEQAYWDPGCPTCVATVSANNKQINRAAPSKGVVVIKLEEADLKDEAVPECVRKGGGVPRVVVTDAGCTKVVDSIDAKADKKRIEEMEAKIAEALGQ